MDGWCVAWRGIRSILDFSWKLLNWAELTLCGRNRCQLSIINYQLSINLTNYLNLRTFAGLVDFDSGLEGFAKLGHVSDSEDAGKVGRNGVDGGY